MRDIGASALRLAATFLVAAMAMVGTAYIVIVGPTAWEQATGHIQIVTLREGQIDRQFRVFRPPLVENRPGLFVVLHGAGGSGRQVEQTSGFDAQAVRLRWIAVYPDGIADGWVSYADPPLPGVADVSFISHVIDRLMSSDQVDPDRVYVTGLSRGGMFAYRLACELSSRLAAIAPVEGNMADPTGSVAAVNCTPSRPVSVLAVHGSADPEIPIEGGRSRAYQEDVSYAPLKDVIARWRALDECQATGSTSSEGTGSTTAWSCAKNTTVEQLVIDGGAHFWPGAVGTPPWGAAASVNASQIIADFFASHRRAPSSP